MIDLLALLEGQRPMPFQAQKKLTVLVYVEKQATKKAPRRVLSLWVLLYYSGAASTCLPLALAGALAAVAIAA